MWIRFTQDWFREIDAILMIIKIKPIMDAKQNQWLIKPFSDLIENQLTNPCLYFFPLLAMMFATARLVGPKSHGFMHYFRLTLRTS